MPGDDALALTRSWRLELRARSARHAKSDAITELAWADHALAEIETALGGDADREPITDGAAPTEALF